MPLTLPVYDSLRDQLAYLCDEHDHRRLWELGLENVARIDRRTVTERQHDGTVIERKPTDLERALRASDERGTE